jgi:hypothetical protein
MISDKNLLDINKVFIRKLKNSNILPDCYPMIELILCKLSGEDLSKKEY